MGQASSTTEGAGKSYLKVDGNKITLDGKRVLLKGAGLGGWSALEPRLGRAETLVVD
jgi:hypothetical protein